LSVKYDIEKGSTTKNGTILIYTSKKALPVLSGNTALGETTVDMSCPIEFIT
jgi:hypothetical protein